MNWHWLSFSDLTSQQLYQVMQLRQVVFVVEQDCVYLDADGYDQNAWHLLGEQNGELVAYCRVLKPGEKYPEASIGRVATSRPVRGSGAGKALMAEAIKNLTREFPNRGIRISAQLYLKSFYQGFGFDVVSEPYDEDGIPHIEMLWNPTAQ